ncbi:MAG: hypothetical protein J6X94_13940 [Lachnospiraceae bacterium]|nr:hypothetical protein [Lachnospiraceae bacterium]
MYGLIFIVIILILLIISGIRMAKEESAKITSFIRDSFGKASRRKLTETRKESLKFNLDQFLSLKEEGDYLDELTWSDTGMEDIFLQMDNCLSSAGEEYLYRRLHDLSCTTDEIAHTDKIVTELYDDESLRISLGKALHELGFVKDRSLPEYLDKILSTDRILNPFFHILCDILYIPAVVLTFIKPVVGVVFIFIIILLQVSSYFSFKRKADECLSGFSMIMGLASMGKVLPSGGDSETGKLITELSDELKKIRLKTTFSALVINSGSNSTGGIFSMLFTYINLLFHFDLIAAQILLGKIGASKETILKAYEQTGFLDMCLALSSYRAFLEGKCTFCRPVFKEGATITIKDGFNPLLDAPVPNDVHNEGGILITGSNASGKSTYMRMIAVNAILARTISTCPAKEYEGSLFAIYSSIAVNDSILKGESYFMAEIRSLKRIVDAADKTGKPVICFIDEIFKGTNTAERIAAADAVLHYLRERNVLVFAATHDHELTTLAADRYDNVHFSEKIEGDDVLFTYKLEKGPSVSTNAIALLRKNGFPEEVIAKSEKLCASLDSKAP